MTFRESLQHLGIEDYESRIFNSNSHGELFHLVDYVMLASIEGDISWFREWFDRIVEFAELNWQRPQSIFQHMPRFIRESQGKLIDIEKERR